MTALTADERAWLRERHVKEEWCHMCRTDSKLWPCPTIRCLDALEALEERLSLPKQVFIVAWTGYDNYTIEKIFPMFDLARDYIAAQSYRTEHYVDEENDWWNVYCGAHDVRTCCETEAEANEVLRLHKFDEYRHDSYIIECQTLEPYTAQALSSAAQGSEGGT